jgi:hypothetical protein
MSFLPFPGLDRDEPEQSPWEGITDTVGKPRQNQHSRVTGLLRRPVALQSWPRDAHRNPVMCPIPQFSTRMAGSYERKEWKQQLHNRLAMQTTTIDPGPVGMVIAVTTGPGRNWANLWKPLIDTFGPVLGEDPVQPFHPHDDRIVSLGLHHNLDVAVAHDVIIDAWWSSL